jgi:hypothetical protein
MRVAFFHGLESPAISEKNTALDSTFGFVYAPPMPYQNPGLFEKVLSEVKKNKIDLLIGSSMGGYFAYCISSLTGIPTLLFNPAMQGRSMNTKVRMGNKSANHIVVFGKNDMVINPNDTEAYFKKEGHGSFSFNRENIEHRIPINVFTKWIQNAKSSISESSANSEFFEVQPINEEWGTEAPVRTDYSFLPEEVVQTLVPNFLTQRPPVGNLTVEDANEIDTVISAQKNLSDSDYRFIKMANDAPHEVFYQWLVLRGHKPSMQKLKGMWKNERCIEICAAIKEYAKRPRPYQSDERVQIAPGVETSDFSFPSGHSCGAYYIASKMSEQYPHLSDSLFNLAEKIAQSRIQAGVHYPSDIEAGKAIGIALAMIV